MNIIIMTTVSVFLLAYIYITDANVIKLRVYMLAAMFGFDYTPSKKVCAIISLLSFYLIYGVVISR